MLNKKKNLALFFTFNVSLEFWQEKGLLNREKIIYELLLRDKVFHQIFWFTYGSNDQKYQKYFRSGIIVVPKPKIFIGKIGSIIYSFLLPIIRKKLIKECSILKTNQMLGSWSAVLSKLLYKKPLFIRTGFTISLFYQKQKRYFRYHLLHLIEKITYRFADAITVTSKADKDYIIKNYQINDVEVNYNFIDTSKFKPLNIPKTKDLVFVGRLKAQKNLFNLLLALQGLDYTLDIYGDGDLKQQLIRVVTSLNLKVNFKGKVSNFELPKILNQYKFFILPSYYEGMPKTLLEAMACGLVCLGTDVQGINEVIENKYNGLLVKTDAVSIRQGIISMMKNEELGQELATKARLTISKKFNLEQVVKIEKIIYNKLI